MKIKIIMGSILAAFLMTMLPSIQAVEHDTAIETKEKWIEENIASIKELFDDTEAPEGIITTLLKWFVKILLIPVKLAIKITKMFIRITCRITWNLLLLPLRLLFILLPPYNLFPLNLVSSVK